MALLYIFLYFSIKVVCGQSHAYDKYFTPLRKENSLKYFVKNNRGYCYNVSGHKIILCANEVNYSVEAGLFFRDGNLSLHK